MSVSRDGPKLDYFSMFDDDKDSPKLNNDSIHLSSAYMSFSSRQQPSDETITFSRSSIDADTVIG